MTYKGLFLIILAAFCWKITWTHELDQSSVYSTTDTNNEDGDHVPISDPRFFTQKIFTKYGKGGNIPFEGFEHLMENLGLGNIDIKDHDLESHMDEDEFRIMHDTHEHSKDPHDGSPASEKRGQRASGDQKTGHKAHTRSSDSGHQSHNHSASIIHDHDHDHDVTKTIKEVSKAGQVDNTQINKVVVENHHDHRHDDHHNNHHDNQHNDHHNDHSDHWEEHFPEVLDARFSVVENGQYVPQEDALLNPRCMSPRDILETFHLNPNGSLNTVKFLLICPAIIWELDQQHCVQRHQQHSYYEAVTIEQWIYSSLAVTAISLCGLFSVAIIPIMQKWFYHTLLQFLVGLAVGSLSGDALLHLLPHALLPRQESHRHSGSEMDAEAAAVWRGMMALGGIYFFFVAERFLNALTAYRKHKKNKAGLPLQPNEMVSNDVHEEPPTNGFVGEKLSHYRKNSYGVKIGPDGKEVMQMLPFGDDRRDSRHSSLHEVGFHGRSSFTADPQSGPLYSPRNDQENYVVAMVQEHHGHGHGHAHEVPQSVSAVAWMVIMGDGLHNFCDGMAIGAAFASGLAGGISTTVAVFCHELPHELGDFAMLLKTGMKVKQALFYNGLSSVLCLIGMVIGLSLGSVESATAWIFAATAGMFIYIALVDMLPELSVPNTDPSSTPSYTLAVQLLGISIGVSVMLLIANYEHELINMVS